MSTAALGPRASTVDLDPKPATRIAIIQEFWHHRDVLAVLARTDFQVRYKRAAFGVAWAVVVPLLQAVVLAVVFSHVVRYGGRGFGVYVLSGVLPWSYFGGAVGTGATAVVDDAELTEKVWFPRSLLPVVPALSSTVGLLVSLVALVAALPLLGVTPGPRLLLLVPATLLLILFTAALSLVLAALHVYFRDVRYLVQAALLLWFYCTPIIYPASLLGRLRVVVEINPLTGVLAMFRAATVGEGHVRGPVVVSVVATVALVIAAIEAYRRHDRLFADLL